LSYGPEPKPVQTPFIDDQTIEQAITASMTYPVPPALPVPELSIKVHQSWTVQRIIALSIDHCDGNIAWTTIYNAASDEDLSKGQAQELVKKIWAMPHIEYDGTVYEVKRGKGHKRQLVAVRDAELQSFAPSKDGISPVFQPETQERKGSHA